MSHAQYRLTHEAELIRSRRMEERQNHLAPILNRASIKPGTWNIPEHFGTFRNIPEHPGTSRNMKKLKYFS